MQEYIDFLSANPILSGAWVVLFVAVIVTFTKAQLSAIKKITHQQATHLINREGAKLVDIRSQDDFNKGHIIDAIHTPLSQLKNNQFGSLEKHKDAPIIVVCNTGMTASQACQMLHKAGFSNVSNLQGGITEWRNANLPLTMKK